MRNAFKQGVGWVLGIFAGMNIISLITGMLKTYVNNVEQKQKDHE